MTPRSLLLCLCLVPSIAVAQEPMIDDEPVPQSPAAAAPAMAPLPESAYQLLRNHAVSLRLRNGVELCGQLLGDDATTLTLATAPSGEVIAVRKLDVAIIRLLDPARPPVITHSEGAVVREPAERRRAFALNLGLTPSIDLDLEYGLFYGFLNANLVFPMASGGTWLGFSAGLGINFPLGASQWRMEIFAHVTPMVFNNEIDTALGVGIGFHYTFRSGFTLGFKSPILGYSIRSAGYGFTGDGVPYYYFASSIGLPLVSLGYRF
jgi:hypothetical protein